MIFWNKLFFCPSIYADWQKINKILYKARFSLQSTTKVTDFESIFDDKLSIRNGGTKYLRTLQTIACFEERNGTKKKLKKKRFYWTNLVKKKKL